MRYSHEQGFSLIELMIGLVIGLITMLVIYQVFATFEAQKRTTGSGSSAQQAGMIGLHYIDRELRQAGYGIGNPAAFGCTTQAWSIVTAAPVAPPFPMAPVVITTDPLTRNDAVTIRYGTSSNSAGPAVLQTPVATQNMALQVTNPNQFGPGDFVLLFDPGVAGCTIVQVSSITPAGCVGNACSINHVQTLVTAPYNPPGATSLYPAGGYSTNAQMLNLGAAVFTTYAVNAATNRLEQTNLLTGAIQEIADNVVGLRAQYGWDVNNDNIIQPAEYIDAAAFPAAPTAAQWQRVLSVRLAILARSSIRERIAPTAVVCTTTTATPGPAWAWGAPYVMRNDADGTPFGCYRYTGYTLIVPLRNAVWSF